MNRSLLLLCVFFSVKGIAQTDTEKWVRAFPVTGYMVDVSDSIKLVQVLLPDGVTLPEKQVGLLRGIYRDTYADTSFIGTGRCNLIKGDYYYFTINYKKSGRQPREGDLLFTLVKPVPVYRGQVIKLGTYYIGLQNVYENPFYDRRTIFSHWEKSEEASVIDSMVADIHFTGNYFLENNPGMNKKIKGGRYDGKMVLNTMVIATKKDVIDFLDYIIARPNLYAGRQWKVSEIFATWVSEGAPTVIKY
jgi:hypothetical protein